ncbi:50S ribosomal protein L16 [Candidatus Uhrbacteria bacterium RIFCSPLOWO2_12_FULL_46_10]|uniref:Large ribosomal subunit protein uL16 n=1 Tax=Candidatus Uhrbacteria bacterium RIFCSPLOWO2_01_FULL_47_25 TaxID=1802402 RepID=A0A1F7UWY1_9BACT|nr:MAG: 50S ribosomal protein L16 [Parcubacteria group bacterium GW2011_GWA2_46_9]OGL59136.1 MAG: 50S ribosomal protein L16 [Candidatus Uhrbacteria bacterium RIFCSPHIGHO2_01_FULL_46_23]OGL70264.1 MAG: 50S ribosomal protein L16 [Candidatus Uhrbacteria bacterium RIFCSPHIGHO2_02_FULL_47_29]OGL74685.1 MAG: 50S ribosomal protein L16 [Candidatus Uhrbacteria bacterium RIFCSPHIGHO2_12_FULL_46_13]OGL82801.1 MAG: 50S ribosomal protein L16 [Candidatus Uhrbacteria bacterium RIFCSPLOWO2_01_FULL_47_25]OGL83
MFLPKKVKHRKHHKGRSRGKLQASRKIHISFGSFGLRATTGAWITSRQIEAGRRAITRHLKRGGKLWIRIFPDKPITFHGSENTMGSGKGSVDHYVAVVRPGTIVFEIDGVGKEIATEALTLAGYKLPVRTKIIAKGEL